MTRGFGYAFRSARAHKKIVFVRGKRYTMLPALSLDGILALDVMEDSCSKERFQNFILTQIVSILFMQLNKEHLFRALYFVSFHR